MGTLLALNFFQSLQLVTAGLSPQVSGLYGCAHTAEIFREGICLFPTPEQRDRRNLCRDLNRSSSLARACGLLVKSGFTKGCTGLGAPGYPREVKGSLDGLAKRLHFRLRLL